LNYTRAHRHCLVAAAGPRSLRCVRPDIVPDPVGCQGAPL